MSQLALKLAPVEPHALSYFVLHSGCAESYAAIGALVAEARTKQDRFFCIYLSGPAGSGKTHLLNGFRGVLKRGGYPEERIALFDFTAGASDEEVGAFVAEYDRLKASGGVLFVEARERPRELSTNPHLTSRLLAGSVLDIAYPREEELKPVVRSLSERHNLNLSEATLEYMIRRLPRVPVSFAMLIDGISEASLEKGRTAGRKLASELMRSGDLLQGNAK